MLLNWYFSTKFFFCKIQRIFDVENRLSESDFCTFDSIFGYLTSLMKKSTLNSIILINILDLFFFSRIISFGCSSRIDWCGKLFWKSEHFFGGENFSNHQAASKLGPEWFIYSICFCLCSKCDIWTLYFTWDERQTLGRYQQRVWREKTF